MTRQYTTSILQPAPRRAPLKAPLGRSIAVAIGFAVTIASVSLRGGSLYAAPPPHPKITGVFSDMHWLPNEGDVLGTEIFIMHSTDGINGQYWVVVQEAEGVPSQPVLVKATLTGDRIEFTVPDNLGGKFTGRISSKTLSGKFEKSTDKTILPRRRSYWQ